MIILCGNNVLITVDETEELTQLMLSGKLHRLGYTHQGIADFVCNLTVDQFINTIPYLSYRKMSLEDRIEIHVRSVLGVQM
jgi:hypothetical protein